MARHEEDREDLLREATALVERAELQADFFPEPIVVGFRRDGSASFYFGGEPVVQFNTQRELRRAYADGRMLKADRGRLVALTRQRTATEVQLLRHELAPEATQALLAQFDTLLQQLADAIARRAVECVGQVPPDGQVVARIADWLQAYSGPILLAQSPGVGRTR